MKQKICDLSQKYCSLINVFNFQIALCKPRNEKCAIKRIDLDKTEFSIEKVIEEVNVSGVITL